MSVASVTTSAISLLVLGVFLALSLNVNYILMDIASDVGIVVYLDDEVAGDNMREIRNRTSEIEGVAEAKYVSKEELLARLKEQLGEHDDLLEAVEEMNPLRNSIEVKVEKPEYASEIARTIREFEGVNEVEEREELMKRLSNVLYAARWVGLALIVILAAASILVISNTVRLSVIARRREVAIMKVVGATDGFIRWPFFLEGMLLGLIGAAVAGLILWQGYIRVSREAAQLLPFMRLLADSYLIPRVEGVLLGAGAAIGAVGSSWSLRRFLRV